MCAGTGLSVVVLVGTSVLVGASTSGAVDLSAVSVVFAATDKSFLASAPGSGGPYTSSPFQAGQISPDGSTLLRLVRPTGAEDDVVTAPFGHDDAAVVIDRFDRGRVRVLGWTWRGQPVIRVTPKRGSPQVQTYDTRSRTWTPTPRPALADGAISPDGTVEAVGLGSVRVGFIDTRTGRSAGRLKLTLPHPSAPNGPDLAWSPDGDRLASSTSTSFDTGTGWIYNSTAAIIDLRSRSFTSQRSSHDSAIAPAWSPEGTLCWSEAQITYLGDPDVIARAACSAAGTLARGTTVSVPAASYSNTSGNATVVGPGTASITAPTLVPPDPTITRVLHVGATPVAGGAALTVTTRGGSAGVLAVVRSGRTGAPTPVAGRYIGITLDGHLNVDGLRPSTTYTITVFGRSWAGRVSAPHSVRVRTPALRPTRTTITITPHTYAARKYTAHVQVVDAITGRPLAGIPVQLQGQAFYYDNSQPSSCYGTPTPTGPLHHIAIIITDANGQGSAPVPATYLRVRAQARPTTQTGSSNSALSTIDRAEAYYCN